LEVVDSASVVLKRDIRSVLVVSELLDMDLDAARSGPAGVLQEFGKDPGVIVTEEPVGFGKDGGADGCTNRGHEKTSEGLGGL
jgi:hypothetical protein